MSPSEDEPESGAGWMLGRLTILRSPHKKRKSAPVSPRTCAQRQPGHALNVEPRGLEGMLTYRCLGSAKLVPS